MGDLMKKVLVTGALTFLLVTPVKADFVGTLEFAPAGCKTIGTCELVYDFGFIDSKGVGMASEGGPQDRRRFYTPLGTTHHRHSMGGSVHKGGRHSRPLLYKDGHAPHTDTQDVL